MYSNQEEEDEKTKRLRWMFMQQQKQQLSWDDEKVDASRVGLRIIVLQNMFTLSETSRTRYSNRWSTEPNFKSELYEDVKSGCEEFGDIEKITIFDTNPEGIVVVKFKSSTAANNVRFRREGWDVVH